MILQRAHVLCFSMVLSALGALLTAGSAAGQGSPIGGEFQVNTTTLFNQEAPALAPGADGGFVVVWQSEPISGSDSDDIFARRYDSDGNALGNDFQVNTHTTGYQGVPSVGRMPGDGFVVVWQSYGTDTLSTTQIQARRYDAAGSPIGGEFRVDGATAAVRRIPSVAVAPDGDFFVVWESRPAADPGTDADIRGRRLASDGSPIGGEFQVNTFTSSFQVVPSAAAGPSGETVVTWSSFGSGGDDASSTSIQARRFAADGTALGNDFQVNTFTFLFQSSPAVAIGPAGEFVVAWNSYGSDEPGGADMSGYSIQARRYDSSGTAIGDDFQVNTETAGYQILSGVTAAPTGEFLVVWSSESSSGSDASAFSIQGRHFAVDAAPLGADLQINTTTAGSQSFPAVTTIGQDRVVVAWDSDTSAGSDASDKSVQGQRLFLGIFTDGFESGDMAAWSDVVNP